MTLVLDFWQTRDALWAALAAHGVRSEPACYLFEAYDEVPKAMPVVLPPGGSWMDDWCAACADAILQAACAARTREAGGGRRRLLVDTNGDEVCVRKTCGGGEGPRWCGRCGIYLWAGFTECSIETVLSAWDKQRITPDALPELLEGLEFYGDTVPHRCAACRDAGATRHPRWRPPRVRLSTKRWSETAWVKIAVPCPCCHAPRQMVALAARTMIGDVRRWQAFQRLVQRALRQLVPRKGKEARGGL